MFNLKRVIASDPLVKALKGKTTTSRRRKSTSKATKAKIARAVGRAKSKAFKAGLRAARRRF